MKKFILFVALMVVIVSGCNMTPRREAQLMKLGMKTAVQAGLMIYSKDKSLEEREKIREIADEVKEGLEIALSTIVRGNTVEISPQRVLDALEKLRIFKREEYAEYAPIVELITTALEFTASINLDSYLGEETRMKIMAVLNGGYEGLCNFLGHSSENLDFKQRPGTLISTEVFEYKTEGKKAIFKQKGNTWKLKGPDGRTSQWRQVKKTVGYILLECRGYQAKIDQEGVSFRHKNGSSLKECSGDWTTE